MNKLLLSFFCVLLFSFGYSQHYFEKNSVEEQMEDFKIFKTTILECHSGIYDYNDSASLAYNFYKLENALSFRSLSKIEQLALYSKFVSTIKCIHTIAYHKDFFINNLKAKYKLPFDVYFLNNSLRSKKDYINGIDIISKYDRITAINKEPVSEIKDSLYQFISSDGNNMTHKDYYLKNTFLFYYFLYKPQELDFELEYIHNGDTMTSVFKAVRKERKKQKGKNPYERIKFKISKKYNYTHLILSDPLRDTREYNKAIKKIMRRTISDSVSNLIIDLRNLPGGFSQETLMRYFIKEKMIYESQSYTDINSATYKKHFINRLNGEFWASKFLSLVAKESQNNHQELTPQKTKYEGQVYVLINGGTVSAASNLASFLKEWANAIVVGEESGGGYKSFNTAGGVLQLPNSKIRVDVRTLKGINKVRNEYEADGVTPHYVIKQSDYFDSKNDNQLRFVIDTLIHGN